MEQDDVIEVHQEKAVGGADDGETEYITLKVVGQAFNKMFTAIIAFNNGCGSNNGYVWYP